MMVVTYCQIFISMRSWEGEYKKPQFFHQKGWIANNFKVKNNVSAILKTRQKNNTQMSRPECSNGATPIHHRSTQLTRRPKPSTAPAKSRRSREGFDSVQGSPMACLYDELLLTEVKHCNFKTTLNARKPLLFLRPYARNITGSTIDQRKAEIYQEINNPDIANFNQAFIQTGPIEYLTEYAEPFNSSSREKPKQPRNAARHRSSLNVLREKLKRRCEMSFYQSKINMYKQA